MRQTKYACRHAYYKPVAYPPITSLVGLEANLLILFIIFTSRENEGGFTVEFILLDGGVKSSKSMSCGLSSSSDSDLPSSWIDTDIHNMVISNAQR